jgi:hypothetical protein
MCRQDDRGNRFAVPTPILSYLFSEVSSSLPTQAWTVVGRHLGESGRRIPASE